LASAYGKCPNLGEIPEGEFGMFILGVVATGCEEFGSDVVKGGGDITLED